MISLKSRIASVTISAVMFTHCGAPNQGADTRQMSAEAAFGNQPPTEGTPDSSNRETSADAGTNNGGKITQIFQLVGALNDAGIDPIKAWQATNKLTSLLRIAQDGNLSLAARIAQIQRETTKMLADPATKRDLAEQAKVIAHLDPVKAQNIFSRAIINFGGVNDLTTQILDTTVCHRAICGGYEQAICGPQFKENSDWLRSEFSSFGVVSWFSLGLGS